MSLMVRKNSCGFVLFNYPQAFSNKVSNYPLRSQFGTDETATIPPINQVNVRINLPKSGPCHDCVPGFMRGDPDEAYLN